MLDNVGEVALACAGQKFISRVQFMPRAHIYP
jgi:hypothetical protein